MCLEDREKAQELLARDLGLRLGVLEQDALASVIHALACAESKRLGLCSKVGEVRLQVPKSLGERGARTSRATWTSSSQRRRI